MFKDITAAIRPAVVMTLLFASLLGLVYPALITGIGQVAFPDQANGSLIRQGDLVVGSSLIGQRFISPRYFHGRPSAAGKGYDATASSGSNLGPTSKALVARVSADLVAIRHSSTSPAPADLVTTSASGLDPEISPETALWQVDRVAAARGLPVGTVGALVASQIREPLLGIIGAPRVNVLLLNRALDSLPRTGAKAVE